MSEWLKSLNSEQIEAVKTTEGPLLILAGAGSGKTTVLISRTGYIVEKKLAKLSEILVLTFTNKAAKELNERVTKKLGLKTGSKKEKIWTGTFHGFGLEFLKKHHNLADLPKKFGLIDAQDSRFIIKELLKNKYHDENSAFDVETLYSVISNLRAEKKPSPHIAEKYLEVGEWILPEYISRMHSLGVIDFDGLILRPIEVLRKNPELKKTYQNKFKYLMVDEFQDTNKIQMDMVFELINANQNIAVVGDDDQSIYGWRGAEIKNILTFPNNFKACKVVRLQTNYRSTPQIIKLANSIIEKNEDRHSKILNPSGVAASGPLPEIFVYNSEDEEVAEVINLVRYYKNKYNYDDIAVLFRSNAQGGLLEGAFRQNRIPYDLTGGPSLTDRKEVRDALAYIRSCLFPNDISLRRILNTPHRGIGDTSVHKIIEYQKEYGVDFKEALADWQRAQVSDKTGQSIKQFFEVLHDFKKSLLESQISYDVLLPKIFTELKYKELIMQSYKDSGTAQKKWALIEILGRILDGFSKETPNNKKENIKNFLDALALRDLDLQKNDKEKKVQLLTFHASKGLEYPVVILMGVDEGLIPHETLGHNISEERRLFYVGVTRAKKELVLTRARQRKRYGKIRKTSPSRFLSDLPKDQLNIYESGIKPISEQERSNLMGDLYKKLDQISKENEKKLS